MAHDWIPAFAGMTERGARGGDGGLCADLRPRPVLDWKPLSCAFGAEGGTGVYLPISSRPVISSISIMVLVLSESDVDGVDEREPDLNDLSQVMHQPLHDTSPVG